MWKVVGATRALRILHTKWVLKTKQDAEGAIERLIAQLVACGNEQKFGVNYCITFPAVMDMGSVKIILCLARKWRVPAKHGYVPNAYVKADKEAELDVYVRVPQGMAISEAIKSRLGVTSDRALVLKLQSALNGLKQASLRWSKQLQRALTTCWSRVQKCELWMFSSASSWTCL